MRSLALSEVSLSQPGEEVTWLIVNWYFNPGSPPPELCPSPLHSAMVINLT